MFDSLNLRSMLFNSLKLRLTNLSGHKNVKHLVGNVARRIIMLQNCERTRREATSSYLSNSISGCYRSPDRPFHNFRASRSGDLGIFSSSETSCDEFLSFKLVKRSVGLFSYSYSFGAPTYAPIYVNNISCGNLVGFTIQRSYICIYNFLIQTNSFFHFWKSFGRVPEVGF